MRCLKILRSFSNLIIHVCICLMVNALLVLPCFQILLFQDRRIWDHCGTRAWKFMLDTKESLKKIWRKKTKQWAHRFVLTPLAKILLRLLLHEGLGKLTKQTSFSSTNQQISNHSPWTVQNIHKQPPLPIRHMCYQPPMQNLNQITTSFNTGLAVSNIKLCQSFNPTFGQNQQ